MNSIRVFSLKNLLYIVLAAHSLILSSTAAAKKSHFERLKDTVQKETDATVRKAEDALLKDMDISRGLFEHEREWIKKKQLAKPYEQNELSDPFKSRVTQLADATEIDWSPIVTAENDRTEFAASFFPNLLMFGPQFSSLSNDAQTFAINHELQHIKQKHELTDITLDSLTALLSRKIKNSSIIYHETLRKEQESQADLIAAVQSNESLRGGKQFMTTVMLETNCDLFYKFIIQNRSEHNLFKRITKAIKDVIKKAELYDKLHPPPSKRYMNLCKLDARIRIAQTKDRIKNWFAKKLSARKRIGRTQRQRRK